MAIQPQPGGLGPQCLLVGPRSGDHEAHAAHPVHHPRQSVQRQLEALLVHQPPDQQHQALVRRGEPGPQAVEVLGRLEIEWVDPVGDHGDPRLLQAVDVGDVAAHVVRARDDAVGAVGHPPFDPVDV